MHVIVSDKGFLSVGKMHTSLSFFSQTFSIFFHNCISCSFHFDDISNIIHHLRNLPVS